jgi:PAS domain S-box-containing protein
MGKFFASSQFQLSRVLGRHRTGETSALPDRRFSKIITLAWLTLGIGSVALALIAWVVLRSERQSTAILHHMNLISLNLQNVLADLADAENEQRAYLLTHRPANVENFQRSRHALGLEFQRLTALVKNNTAQRQEVERIRDLVEQDLDELQGSISHTAAGSPVAFSEVLTDRARKLTEALRQSITGMNEENEGVLARLARERRTRLARVIGAVSFVLFLAASYVLVSQIMIGRSESRRGEAEAALRASENRFRTLCEQAPLGIYSTDSDGLCVYANSRWLQTSGLSAAENLGHGWSRVLHPDDRETVFETWRTYARQGKSWEFRVLPPDGQIRWIRALGGPLYSPAGEITGYIGTAEDITERKLAQVTMQETLQQLQLITDSLPVGVTRCSRNLRFVWVSRSYAAWLMGTEPEDVVGRTIVDVAGQEVYETIRPYIERVLSGERVEYETQVNYRVAGPRWVHAIYVPTKAEDQEVDGWISVVGDFTQRHEAEQRLRESEARFRIMADAAPVMIWLTGPDGGCIFLNKVWLDFTGRTMEQELGYGWAAGVHPDDRDRLLGIYSSSFDARRGFQLEYRLRRADGEYRWVLNTGVPRFAVSGVFEGYIGSSIDITEQEQLREELQRERERLAEARGMERFRMSFEEAPVGMALIRGDGVWLRVNRALCQTTGYSESELISRNGDITHVDDRAEESRMFSRILSGEVAAGSLEERYLHKQGHTINIQLSIAAVERDEVGRPVHLVAHVQDLTERKRVEQELETSRAQMVSSSRLSALGMMAGGIAHEINTPLAVIRGSVENIGEMAESGSVEVPEVLKNCHRIRQTADRISKIVRSLRHVAREGGGEEFRETPVRQIVEETLELCAERFRAHNIRLSVSAIDPEAVINCREVQICQILLNLLQNAFDEVVDLEGDRWVALDVSYSPDWVTFSVSDSGPGIAMEHRSRIMEPFFTTKPVGKGTGLGLSISRSIALEHGGTLELDHAAPHTCFRLKLPICGMA